LTLGQRFSLGEFWGLGVVLPFAKMIRRQKVVARKAGKLFSFSLSLLTKAI